jgi:4-hydroxy-tetrahydrodipicolinate synthase
MPRGLFQGTGTALVTPFKEDGQINYEKLEDLINWQIESGVDALVITATTGEASSLPDEEHIQVVKSALEANAGRVPIIAGCGSNDTRHGIALVKSLSDLGVDALLNVTPYYNKTNQIGLIEHFKVMARATDLPMILYNVPSRTNLNIEPETYQALSDVPNILGIKECNFNQVSKTRYLTGDHYAHYSGEDLLVVPMLSMGASGVISVLANLVPDMVHAMTEAWFDGRIEEARALQIKLEPLVEALFCEVSPIPVKYAMNLMGLDVGPCRLPLGPLSDRGKKKVEDTLEKMGLWSPSL